MIKIRCTEEEQKKLITCFVDQHFCVANNPFSYMSCWSCDRECVKTHIEWEIIDEKGDKND